jgi:uridine kinase
MIRAAALEALADLIESAVPRPLRVGIDGLDTAGKTTLADELAALLTWRGCVILRASVDDFHRPRAERHRRCPDSPEGYYHDTFDVPAVRALLLDPLGPTGDPAGSRRVRVACYDLAAEAPLDVPAQVVPPETILLCDGVFLHRPALIDGWDVSIYVRIRFDEVLRRAAIRDAERFGGAGATVARYRRRYLPGQRLYLAEVDPAALADAILDNDDPAHPRLTLRNLPSA